MPLDTPIDNEMHDGQNAHEISRNSPPRAAKCFTNMPRHPIVMAKWQKLLNISPTLGNESSSTSTKRLQMYGIIASLV